MGYGCSRVFGFLRQLHGRAPHTGVLARVCRTSRWTPLVGARLLDRVRRLNSHTRGFVRSFGKNSRSANPSALSLTDDAPDFVCDDSARTDHIANSDGPGSGGIVTIALASIGDRYPYVVQGRPMGTIFGAIAAGMGLGSSLGPILNPLVGWRSEFRALAGFALGAIFLGRRTRSFILAKQRSYSYHRIALEYLYVLDSPRGRRTMAFIFCNGVFHGGIFACLGLLIASRYRLDDVGIGMVLAGYGLPDLLFGGMIGGWGDSYGRRYVVPIGFFFGGRMRPLSWVTGFACHRRCHNHGIVGRFRSHPSAHV